MFVDFLTIIADEILYFAIIDWMTQRSYKYKIKMKVILIFLASLLMLLLPEIHYDDFFNSCIMLVAAGIYLMPFEKSHKYFYQIFFILSTMGINVVIRISLGLITAVICCLTSLIPDVTETNYLVAIVVTVMSILIYGVANKIQLFKLYKYKGLVYITGFFTILLIVIKQIGILYMYSEKVFSWLMLCFWTFLLIFGTLWALDHYHLSRMKQKIEQDNTKMNSDLHRTKELMPLLLSVVNGNQDLLDEKIVEEFKQIYSEQMISERKEEMNYKLLGSTGIKLLDAQVQHYIFECTKKGIQMDAFITEPVAQKIQQLKIAQLQIHRLLGDLLRNAVRAIERSEISNGKILCIIGMKDEVLEIDVFDNGMEIPVKVLEHFGKRGVTTGGTGNGLADTLELLEEHGASLVIKENAPEASAYIKGFQIIFDGRNRRELISYRGSGKFLKKKGIWKIRTPEEFAENFE